MQTSENSGPSPREANYNLIAAALATAAATMLTLLTTLGTTSTFLERLSLKVLFEAQLLDIETALILAVVALIFRREEVKRRLVLSSAILVVLGTLLLWLSATLILI